MLKKRIIFTLVYDQGTFVLSRNFRLQKVGDLRWLKDNYDFSRVAFSIDELIILDIYPAREEKIEGVDAKMLAKLCRNELKETCSKSELLSVLKTKELDVLLTMGAGDIWRVGYKLLDQLKK